MRKEYGAHLFLSASSTAPVGEEHILTFFASGSSSEEPATTVDELNHLTEAQQAWEQLTFRGRHIIWVVF